MKPLSIIAVLSACMAFAGTPVELKNAGFHEPDGKGGAVGWSHHPNWHAEKAGHNGSGALVWECASESEVQIGGPGQEVKLKPGKRYDFSAIFKPDGVVTQRKSIYQGLTLYVEGYDANGKWMFGDMARPPVAGKSDDWIKLEGMTREIPDGVAKAYFRVMAKRCVSGRGAVDNVYLAERETVAVEGVFPHVYRRESTGGPVRFSASINADVHENKLEDYSVSFTYVAGNEKKTIPGQVVSPVEAVATLDTSLFAFGTNDVVCTLYLKGKEIGSAAVPFAHLAKPTPRRVYIDRHLRTIVEGKPFFPLGMCYWGNVTKEGLERYAEGPFNCVNTSWSMQPEALELCREKGLLAICGLENGFDEPDEGKAWLTARVNVLKDHPTVMGWFVSDEQPIADIPKMRRRQEWMETLDPNHPTWFALDTVREARHYLGTADVMGLDPYPIPTKPIGLVHSTTCQGVTNTFGAMANWQFPQAFGWGWLKRRETKGQRAPTQKEMANMGWQAIAGGANGLIFYAYQHLSEPHDDPEDAFEPAWARTKAMAEEFKKYSDVFLSIDPAPTAKSSNGDVAVRTWRYKDDTYLLAVNCTTNAQTATITLSEPLGEVVAADFAPTPKIDGKKVQVSLDPISYLMLRTKKAARVFAQDREVFVHDPNYDKDKIPPYTLEDPLVFANGRKVSSVADWTARRREILEIFAKEMYGAEPPAPETLVTELADEKDAIDGHAVRRQYRMWFKADKSGPCITWIMWIPKFVQKPVPVISFLNYRGNHELVPDEDIPVQQGWTRDGEKFGITNWTSSAKTRGVMQNPNAASVFPVGMILARGYAVMSACYCEVSPDPERTEKEPRFMQNPFAYTGVFELWGRRDPSRTDDITALGAWAWALSRGLDLAERVPELDAQRAVVTGCSRLGKAALIAAARDERFAVCVPNQTGGGGVPLAKRDYGENVSTENRAFTHWYCRAYAKYAEAPWRDLPFDQHLFIACIAPRALLVEGFDKPWFDTEGEYLAVKAASPVWTFLGKGGMPGVAWPADYDTSAIGRHLGYVRRAGSHGLSAYDWTWLMDFADGVFRHDATPFDELMPRPVKVEATATGETSVVPVAALGNVTVIRGQVPEAPTATADEAYILEIGFDGAKITASGPFGEIWARVTLDQLVRLAGGGEVGHAGRVTLPCCRIVDWPRLKWRGFMFDSVRNYLPPQGVKDIIDMMSRYKLNLFHWHLTENYAWRLESKRFPELQSERAFLHRHKGKFYTQEEFREIVDYAYARGVRMMPEFDFPGHALAFRRAFGFKTMSDPGVAEKAAALFEELCTLAPKEKMPFIHMGTDEVFKREVEGAPRETLERMAKAIADGGRTMVSWVPGEEYASPGPRINMLWTDKVSPDKNPGAYFDAIGMYIEDFDPFELLSVAVYHKAARWHDAGDLNQGAIFCAWHDGFVGLPYENLLRNQPIFPSCVLFGDAYWHGRDNDLPQFRKRLPLGGDPLLAEAVDIERRVVAQRDRVLCDLKHPFHFLRQTGMRWRLTKQDGKLIEKDIAQATISPARHGCKTTDGTVIAETWIKSPKTQTVGAWIGFTNISRDHGLVYSAPLPDVGEWNRFGATIELNGEKIAPPKWKRPGLKKGNPVTDWTPAWTLYEADEEPFTDQEYFMREPTPIHLRKGWNHVRLTIPNPAEGGKTRHRWTGTFIPVEGATDHPREVQGLEYASEPPL